jgi:nitrogenase subunit NifH
LLSALARRADELSRKRGVDLVPIEAKGKQTAARLRAALAGVCPALFVLLAACSPQRDSTPLPTRQTTIDPVMKKLDAADAQAEKRREEIEAATK